MLRPANRPGYVAQEVLEQLAGAILSGELPEGSTLPSERKLAERFQVSRVLVRQAIHRLAEMGLVTVRQGAATRIGSVAEAAGTGLLELVYRLGDRLPDEYEDYVIERQYLNGLSLLELAARRGTPAERRAVLEWVDDHAPERLDEFLPFERELWFRVARAGHNPILLSELRWWYGLIGEHMPRPASVAETPLPLRIAFHRELARRLVDSDDAPGYYMAVVGPILDGLRSS